MNSTKNLFDAIKHVPNQTNKPMHIKDIYKQIRQQGLWKSSGKTPEATIGAKIYTDIKKNGSKSPFVKVKPQVFGLRQ